jgi:integrase/recombinase XerD
VAVLHGKGDRARVVALDAGACAIVDRWAAERRTLGLAPRAPMFCVISRPTAGESLASSYVRELLHRLGAKAGIQKRVHPHGLRHSYASYLMDNGVPIHHIRRMLGHSSIAVTERYADHLNPAAVLEEMRAVEWPDHQR